MPTFSTGKSKGSGKFHDSHRMSSDMPKAMPDQSSGESPTQTLDHIQQQRELKFEEKVLMTVLSWQKQAEENQRKKHRMIYKASFKLKQPWSRALRRNIYSVSRILADSNS